MADANANPATSGRWSTVTLVIGVAVAGALGYVVGRRAAPQPAVVTQMPTLVAESKSDRTRRTGSAASPVADEHADADASGAWRQRWETLSGRARTPRVERDMGDALAELAARDHESAMKLALAEPNLRARAALRNAVLRGWAQAEPKAAADWALALGPDDRIAALDAVFAGAVEHPAEAAKVGASVCDRDPEHSFDYGQSLVAALADRGEYETAVQFVTGRPPTPQRIEQTEHTFTTWAQTRPSEALAALEKISDPETHDAAFRGAVVGWSQADPASLADYAIRLPAGDNRAVALSNAVPRWVEQDPVAAATWLSQRDPSPELDMGVVAVATLSNIATQRPELAFSLARSVSDPNLRSTTLRQVALRWGEKDAAAATQYVESSPLFPPAEREAVIAEIRAGTK